MKRSGLLIAHLNNELLAFPRPVSVNRNTFKSKSRQIRIESRALPPDVRKVSDLPTSYPLLSLGLRPGFK